MATGNINLELSKDTYELFRATRAVLCESFDCRKNQHNYGDAECLLKKIMIGANGKCEQYEKVENA